MKREEDALQIATAHLAQTLFLPEVVAWHTPNGGRRSKAEAGRFKAMGVLAGVADWTIIWSPGGIIPVVLFVELKSKTGSQSSAQKEFAERADKAGCIYAVARSVDEFLEILRRNGVPMKKARVTAGAERAKARAA